jgi:hypothetical protein
LPSIVETTKIGVNPNQSMQLMKLKIAKQPSVKTPMLRSLSQSVLSPDNIVAIEPKMSEPIMIEADYLRNMNLYNTINNLAELSLVNPLDFE